MSGYIGNIPVPQSTQTRDNFTATSGQTTFSTSGYTPNYLDVYLNGVHLDPSDYTATNGTDVVLNTGATAGDVLEVVAFTTFTTTSDIDNNSTTTGTLTVDGGDVSFYEDTGTTAKFFWDASAESLGIGTSNTNSRNLYVEGAGAYLGLNSTAGGFTTVEGFDNGTKRWRIGQIGYGGADGFSIYTGASDTERLKINSSGNVGIGVTSVANRVHVKGTSGDDRVAVETTNTSSNASFEAQATNYWSEPNYRGTAIVQYDSAATGTTCGISNASMGHLRFQNGVGGLIYTNGSSPIVFGTTGTERMRIDSSGNLLVNCTTARSQNTAVSSGVLLQVKGDIVPDVDAGNTGHSDVGDPSYRFEDMYSRDGVTSGSDRNDKQQIAVLTDAEMNVAKRLSALFKTYKWNDSVEEKGDNARTHSGIMAQDVQQAFTDEGLDASNYAMFMSNTWWQKEIFVDAVEAVEGVEATYDEEGNELTPAVEAVEAQAAYSYMDIKQESTEGYAEKTRLGVRYLELFAFINAYNDQRFTDIESRLAALENA